MSGLRKVLLVSSALAVIACGDDTQKSDVGTVSSSLENRAYIVSLESDELTVIDLDRMEIVGRVPTGGVANHMAELNKDFTKIYVDSSETDQTMVIDTRTLTKVNEITLGKHPTHISLALDGSMFAIMNEGDNAVSFVNPETDTVIKTLPGFYTPHFMRFSPEGKYGYVANIGAHHITRVDLQKLAIDREIVLDGHHGSPEPDMAADETGFGDCQINQEGILYAAHAASGKVLAYDTKTQTKIAEIKVGERPWIAYAEHPFHDVPLRHLVPNFGSQTVSLIDAVKQVELGSMPGDEEAYGVNYNTQRPELAYVMNRVRQDVAVVNIETGSIVNRIAVGGNTETASTTADGKYIVAAVSSANRVVIIDARTQAIKKIFENVGKYPWSVTIPGGQNYCH
jgi:YVTN family beta-propeller protein